MAHNNEEQETCLFTDKEKLQAALKDALEEKDQEKSQFSQLLDNLNSGASFLAAALGVWITFQTFLLGSEVDRLKENVDTSSLVGELIASLTAEDQKQDIALLALEHALTDELDDERQSDRNKELVAEIAAKILENSYQKLVITGEAGSGAEFGQQLNQSGRTARKILRELEGSSVQQDCQATLPTTTPTYIHIAQTALNDYRCHLENLVTRDVQSPSTIAGGIDIGDATDDEGTATVLKLEGDDIEDSASETDDLALITQAEAVSTYAEDR
ncbi:MAG: hypothetical protein F6K09_05765, partial [Merismopedia sp. SIO2A8]|nr:hypothetical protein [Merismopedia sp. SIO2A8]